MAEPIRGGSSSGRTPSIKVLNGRGAIRQRGGAVAALAGSEDDQDPKSDNVKRERGEVRAARDA